MQEQNLEGKCALVTGGNRGIGRAIALTLASHGARVCITGQNETTLQETAEEINKLTGEGFAMRADARKEDDQQMVFDAIMKKFGWLDICVPNAGVATLACASETALEDWNRDIETNLTGLFLTARGALRIMKGQNSGYILPIISQAGTKSYLLRASYCASKWGGRGFTQALALEAKKYNVRVTAICPASVATDFQKENPWGTDWMIRPEEVADSVIYLLGLGDYVHIDEIILRTWQKPTDKK